MTLGQFTDRRQSLTILYLTSKNKPPVMIDENIHLIFIK